MDQNDRKTGLWIYISQQRLHWWGTSRSSFSKQQAHRSESQVLRSLCKNKEGKEEVAVTHAKSEGALVVFTEDMEVPKMAKIHNYIAKVEICPAIYIYWKLRSYLSLMRSLTYSDLELSRSWDPSSQTWWVSIAIHWCLKFLFFEKGPPRVTQIVNYLKQLPHAG